MVVEWPQYTDSNVYIYETRWALEIYRLGVRYDRYNRTPSLSQEKVVPF